MKRSDWARGLRFVLGNGSGSRRSRKRWRPAQTRRASFELLEDRRLLAVDYGDAPDISVGTGPGNYNTLSTDNGAQHTIVVGLRMGANVDGDGGALQNAAANADDVNGALPDDEDGLLNPGADLVLTIGAQPKLNFRVTNTTGAAAILYGWIDYNGDGVFDNATERASIAVPNGTNNLIQTLTLPAVPTGFTGTTYARFRLSTDAAAADPTGAATDGEVEDYRVSITAPSSGLVDSAKTIKIASGTSNGPTLANSDYFGRSVAAIGDLDGDGVTDLAVGANGDDTSGSGRGSIHVLLMNANGTVKSRQEINGGSRVGMANGDYFGASIASLGDLDGDGVTDLAVGAERSDFSGGSNSGTVYVVFLNANGTQKDYEWGASFGLGLVDGDYFGRSVASIGDLDGDGVTDLAVGAYGDNTGGSDRGAVHVLFMNANGSVKSSQKVASGTSGGPTLANSDKFGNSVASLGDLDGDGVRDLAVGAIYDDTGGTNRGAVHVLFMNSNGTVKSSQKIASGFGGGPTLTNGDQFGASVASLGDLDGDGVTDLAVGANYDDTGGTSRGAIHVLFLNANGTVKAGHKIASGTNGGPTLANDDRFGAAVTSMGDLDGDGLTDLAVGASFDDTGGTNRGAIYTLFLTAPPVNTNPTITSPNSANVPENTTSVMTVTATDADVPPQAITFSIVGGTDQARFSITTGGALSFNSAPNFESPADSNGDNVYVVTVQASDGAGGTATQTVSVTVTPVNDNNPVFTSSNTTSVPENTSAVVTVTATDADLPSQSLVYSIVGGADQSKFGITSGGALSFNTPPDFEAPTDSNGDNVYVVTVQASDGQGGTTTQTISVTVTNATENTPPVFTSPNTANVPENSTAVLTVTATDAQSPPQTITFSLVGGADQSRFAITSGGALSFTAPRNFEAPVDANGDNVYVVTVQASDGQGGTATQTISVTVLPVNDNNPTITSPSSVNIAENSTAVMTVLATDADLPQQILTFSLVGGADQSRINITSGGALSFVSPPNFEAPIDANGDNIYVVTVQVSDGQGGTATQTISVSVTAVNDHNPIITSPSTASVAENISAVMTVTATDADLPAQVVTFSIVGGADQARFNITSGGALSFNSVPDYEAPTDANGDNVYLVTVQASDGNGGTATQSISVTVTPRNDNLLVFTSPNSTSLPENVTSVMTVTALDADLPSQAVSFSLLAAGDSSDFSISAGGQLTFNSPPDFETPMGVGGNLYLVYVFAQSTDGDEAVQLIVVTVTPVNDNNPVFTSPANVNVPENTTQVMTVAAIDADLPAQALTFSIVGGVDQSKFAITAGGLLTFNAAPDFEAPTDANGDNVYVVNVEANDGNGRVTTQSINVSVLAGLEDFGDAPDAAVGNGLGDYNTRSTDNGPSHEVTSGLRIGSYLDADSGTAQNPAANADDLTDALPDDEDGLTHPAVDLMLTAGTQPSVNVRVTNTTGAAATLYGWIDYNTNGVFDNATERASVAVPSGTNNGIVTLVFPTVPSGFTGTTYARFRLSSDAAAANPTGAAFNGEVEDYQVTITKPNDGTVDSNKTQKIAHNTNGGPTLMDSDFFGNSVVSIGDLDGDGVTDLAAGALLDDTGGTNRGAVYVLFMNLDGTVKSTQEIASGVGGGPVLGNDRFGRSLAALGDLDGDGVMDLAVGADLDDTGGTNRGAVHVLFLNADGTVKASQKIASGVGSGPALANVDRFGSSVAAIGDLDGDGLTDLVVGADGDGSGGPERGAAYVLFLNANGTVKAIQEIANLTGGGPNLVDSDRFGRSVAGLGDIDGDGVTDLAVGALGDDTGGSGRGAVYVLFMNSDGTVKAIQKIASGVGGGPVLADQDELGFSVAAVGDVDGDGVNDLAAGASYDDAGGTNRGAIYVMFLNADGTVKGSQKIASNIGGGPVLGDNDRFGSSIAMIGDLDGDGLADLAVGAEQDDTGGTNRGSVYVLFAAAFDFGDAPDLASGTAAGDYQTLLSDNGPRHSIVAGLKMGSHVDNENGTLANAAANADDVHSALPDDEDGLVNPVADLALTVGAQPTIDVRVSNSTGATATLFGWIDYNADGVFDNITERGSVAVPNGTNNGIVTLTLPAVVGSFTGTTYARFRLSTDIASANPTGAAADGEVEDYRATIVLPSNGTADPAKTKKIAHDTNGGPTLADSDQFGVATASIGDLDGDSVTDVVVGAERDDTGGLDRGAVHVLFMNADGTVKGRQKIASGLAGAPTLADGDRFGRAVASLGDLDGDGVTDLAVGTHLDDTGGDGRGATHVLFLNADGTVKQSRKIASNTNGGPTLADGDRFGTSLAAVGDLDGDGVTDLAVGADYDDAGGSNRGAIHVLFLNGDGTVKASQKVASGIGGGPLLANSDNFGSSIASLGDLDGDGVSDLVVGAIGDDTGGGARGAVHVLLMNSNGTVKSSLEIASGTNGGPTLSNGDSFGVSVAALGDLDADGVTDLAVGAIGDGTGGSDRGAVHVILLNANGSVKSSHRIAHATGGGPTLENVDRFGRSIAAVGDLDGDGVTDLAVGASADNTGGADRGAVHVLFLKRLNRSPVITSANTANVAENGTAVMTVTATDPDLPPQPLSFSIVGGADQAKFSITGGGLLSFSSPPNFEAPTDANGDNVYVVNVQASDGEGGTTTQTISVTVTPVNDNSPVFTSPDAASVPENTTAVMTVTATDADLPAQSLTYSIVGGADQAKFSITSGGALSFSSAPNFEAPTDSNGDNVYVVIVQASDGGLTSLQVILVSVTGVNDNNPVITSPTAANVPENTTSVMTVTATDADLPSQALTFSIVGGVDQSKFSITSGGALSFTAAPNFEAPTDANGDNVYVVIVQASDGSLTGVQALLVTVTPVNDNNPVFTSANTANVAENSTAVLTVTATDADLPLQSLMFSIVGGADQAHFTMSSGGALSFLAPPNFEAPTDANADNVYVVTVQASDGNGGLTTQTINVTVTPVNDNTPVFTSPDATSVAENTTAVMTLAATDADLPAQALTFSIVGGADQSKFSVTNGGVLSFSSAPDFETPTDANGDNVYVVIVQASDGSLSSLHAILVTVTNVGEPPALLGDYNVNGTVDAADYVFWRKMLGTGVVLAYDGADGDGDATTDEGDYSVWKARFGQTLPPGSSPDQASVEPGLSFALAALAEPTSSPIGSVDPLTERISKPAATLMAVPLLNHRHAQTDVRMMQRRAAFTKADARWDRGLLSWLSELDRDLRCRVDSTASSASTDEGEITGPEELETIDAAFSSESPAGWKGPADAASSLRWRRA